ncbi:MAG: metallophosphoesterase, partial [Verrucomicrobiae bacterium]|nr:metallophosphoesterase [Verrucomicrobiae bacterium]
MRKMKFWSIVSLLSLCFASSIAGKTDTILILHTNDIHDHVRPDYDGVGGLPYVSGYIRQMKSERKDVLVLDAGDVAEKGDMVAFATHSEMTYEALARIGYHAGAPGNHEHDFVGIPGLKKFESLAGGMKMLCINLIDENKRPRFDPSAIFDIDGVRVGVIGMIVSRKENCLDKHETAVAMAREAERLEPLTDLIVASCHFGSSDCADISRVAPNIDVFVSGHSHEVLRHHMRVPETGAVIVQAGSYAEYVGRLEIVLDMDSEKMIEVNSELVPMDHDTIPVDGPMLQWIRIKEKELTPEASRIIASSDVMIGPAQVGQLAATALREYGNSDVGFCAADQVIRAGLPIGRLDVNAFFRTGGERGY